VTHACCPRCRIRFTPAAAAHLVACPQCGEPPQPSDDLREVLGFRLFRLEDVRHSLPEAVAVAVPIPDQVQVAQAEARRRHGRPGDRVS
jgi:hypothetical protein